MAPPNTLFIPEIARKHAQTAFLEVLTFFQEEIGVIDMIPDSSQGGNFFNIPRWGKLSSGFGRVDVAGTLTTTQTSKTMTNKNEIGVVVHESLLMEYFHATPLRAGETQEGFSAEIGRQIGIEAVKEIILNLYKISIASADSVADDHDHEPYVDTLTASNQVDMTATVIQAAKFLLGDQLATLKVAVCHSKQWNDLALSSISTSFNVPNVMGDVYRGGQFEMVLGTRFIVDDRMPTAAGPTTASPTKYQAIFLRPRQDHPQGLAPLVISFQQMLEIFEQHVLGLQSVKFQRQPHMAVGYGVRGKTWDTTNGGVNPTIANLATATNWDDAYADHKEHGIILLRSN